MTNLTPESWTETEDFREVVKPDQQADFLKRIAEAHSEGREIYSVLVVGGVPMVFSIRDKT